MRQFLLTAMFVPLLALAAPVSAATLECAELGTVHSQNSPTFVVVNFHNATTETRQLNWVSLDGEVVEYVTIRPDRRVGQPIGTGDYWVIADEAGECLFLYKAEAAETFEITD
jgi:hypothetical protein